MDFAAMCLGYLVITLCLLWLYINVHWHTHLVLTESIAEIRMAMRIDDAKIYWHKLPWAIIKRWFTAWSDPAGLGDSTSTWPDVGSWTTPTHIFSFGTYNWCEPWDKPKVEPEDPTLNED